MDADKKKFDMFLFVQKSLFLWDRCRRAKLIFGHRLISNIISVLCDKRNKETNKTAVSNFVFYLFYH